MNFSSQLLPSFLIVFSTLLFLIAERVAPGRELPHSKGWFFRAILINFIQLAMIGLAGLTWNKYFREYVLFDLGGWKYPAVEGLFYWFVGTFVFYWWHRLRHAQGFWVIFHQLHHSPQRIEVLTSFYKHPVEVAADSILIGFIIYSIFGGTAQAGAWYALYAATGEYFYHANIKTPHWLGYFIQRPEHHSIHHQLDVHKYNYSDIPLWDRLFGTFKDTKEFAKECGFPSDNERHFKDILKFRDVYQK
jgi:sterol desaturase/sphingolipid hydroxylase (fatty acid hydroxylase superfamily)